jgi:hypothetical protein
MNLFLLALLLQVKHFVVDYPLQTEWMLGKFKSDWGFFWPLFTHCLFHGIATAFVLAFFTNDIGILIFCGGLNMAIHFVMDRVKASPKYLGRYKPLTETEFAWAKLNVKGKELSKKLWGNKIFWWSLGFDQLVHGLTDLLCGYLVHIYG